MRSRSLRLLVALGVCAAAAIIVGSSASAGGTQLVPLSGTGAPQTGPFTPSDGGPGVEFAGEAGTDASPGANPGTIVNRSLSVAAGHGASVTGGHEVYANDNVTSRFEA